MLSFANIKSRRAVFRTHLEWSTLTFSGKYKKIVFQTRNYLFRKLFFLVIIRNYFPLENLFFSDKYKKFFLRAWKIYFLRKYKKFFFGQKIGCFKQAQKNFSVLKNGLLGGKYKNFFFRLKKNFWVGVSLVACARSVLGWWLVNFFSVIDDLGYFFRFIDHVTDIKVEKNLKEVVKRFAVLSLSSKKRI